MKLHELVDAPELGIRVLHGGAEAMSRSVGWTYTTDLLDPSRYLSRGLLVMTGLAWRRTPEDSETYVATLVASEVAALVAGEGLLGYVPDDVVQACRRHDLPLLAVTPNVSFVEITEYIAREVTNDRVTRLTATLVRQRQLLAEIADGRALDELVLQVSRESGLACWVTTSTGRQIVPGANPLPADEVDRITAAALSAETLPVTSAEPGGASYSIFGVGGSAEHRLTGWYVVVGGDWADWSSSVVDAIGELAAIAALDKSRSEGSHEAWYKVVDDAVGLIGQEGDRRDSSPRLSRIGLDVERQVLAVVGGFAGSSGRRSDTRWILTDAAAHAGRPVVGLGRDGHAVALIALDPAHVDEVVAVLRAALQRIAPVLGGDRFTVGISQPSTIPALGGALRSARYARQLGESHDEPVNVVRSTEVNSAVLLLNSVPDNLRRTFAHHVLGPVIEYDEHNDAGLLVTLTAFFECAGSWNKTAERLRVHLNTVRYRIARVEKLTERDLGRMDDRMDLYLALRLM